MGSPSLESPDEARLWGRPSRSSESAAPADRPTAPGGANIAEKMTRLLPVKLLSQLVESRGAQQAKEFRVEAAEVVGECDPETYPIQKQALTVDYLCDQCRLRARADKIDEMLRVHDDLSLLKKEVTQKEGFLYMHTSITTSSDCEGAGEAFAISSGDAPSAFAVEAETSSGPSAYAV
ncbi:hypothetical protein M0805_003521 [Coniferiporia weirii]|nr:hypothetical protein M0805_003521 [Coniferiporia weirii]